MTIRVLFFAGLRDAAGKSEVSFSTTHHCVNDVLDELAGQMPVLNDWRPRVRLAINETYCSGDDTLSDGDTLALIPPVSGG